MLKILPFHLLFLFGNYHSTEPVSRLLTNGQIGNITSECQSVSIKTDAVVEVTPLSVLLSM